MYVIELLESLGRACFTWKVSKLQYSTVKVYPFIKKHFQRLHFKLRSTVNKHK